MGKTNSVVEKVLGELNKDKGLLGVKHLDCKKSFVREGEEIFKEGKKYKIKGVYGSNFLIITEKGFGHSIMNGGGFMREYFKEL